MSPYSVVEEFEYRVAEYAGAPYGVAVNSCTSALMLSMGYRFMHSYERVVVLPKHTYVGVPMAVLMAGGRCGFRDGEWSGAYHLLQGEVLDVTKLGSPEPKYLLTSWRVVDSARRFRRDMYQPGTLYCLSFHWHKHLPVGRGGMILTDDAEAADTLRRMRYDGRAPGVPPAEDMFDVPGWHVYMIPEDAARGLMLMANVRDAYEDIPWDNYPDLSRHPLFQEGYHAFHS